MKTGMFGLAGGWDLSFTAIMTQSTMPSSAGLLILVASIACGEQDAAATEETFLGETHEQRPASHEDESALSERQSEEALDGRARSTVTFSTLQDAMSSQPIVETLTEADDGSASTVISYNTLIGDTNLLISLAMADTGNEVELPTMGSLVLLDSDGSWEALGGVVRVSAASGRLTLSLDGVRLHSEDANADRDDLSGLIAGEVERQCFSRGQDERPELGGGARSAEPVLDERWETPFCEAQRSGAP